MVSDFVETSFDTSHVRSMFAGASLWRKRAENHPEPRPVRQTTDALVEKPAAAALKYQRMVDSATITRVLS